MKVVSEKDYQVVAEVLKQPGAVAVLRTDTLYGLVARAADEAAVARVYELKNRDPNKSCIILVPTATDAYDHVDELESDVEIYGEVPTSFLISAESAPSWLKRTNELLAYRIPNIDWLKQLLVQTGPLIAPSANPESLTPAATIDEAMSYFGDQVDCYVDGGAVPADTPPSRLLRIYPDGTQERLR